MNRQKMFRARKQSFQDIAESRIEALFVEAEKVFSDNPILSNKYVALARRLSTRYKVALTKRQKLRFCKICGSFLVSGKNARFRLSKGNMVIRCWFCNSTKRLKYR